MLRLIKKPEPTLKERAEAIKAKAKVLYLRKSDRQRFKREAQDFIDFMKRVVQVIKEEDDANKNK